GGSKATGGPATGVPTAPRASGAGAWADWIGRPGRARPGPIAARAPAKRSATRRRGAGQGPARGRHGPRGRGGARRGGGARRPARGGGAVVARAEHDGGKPADVVRGEGAPAGKPHFDGAAAGHVLAVEAGGQGGGIVGDHQVAGPQELDERGAKGV